VPPTTLPAIRPDTPARDILRRPLAPPPTTPPPAGGGAPPTGAAPPAKSPADERLDNIERRNGIPPTEPEAGYPSGAPTEPGAGVQAGRAVGQVLAIPPAPRIPGAGETQVAVAGLPARALQQVQSAVRRLGPTEAAAQVAPPEGEGGPPPETKTSVLPSSTQLEKFQDAIDHYVPLRRYVEGLMRDSPRELTATDLLYDSKVVGMANDWATLRSVLETKAKKIGEVGAAERRVLTAIRGVLTIFDMFDVPEQQYGSKRAIDYLPTGAGQELRIELANILREMPGLGRMADQILDPSKTGLPTQAGQELMPGAQITKRRDTPEGRATQTLLSLGKGFLAQLARGSSEVGNLNTFEQANMRDAYIPDFGSDSPASAAQKLALGRQVFRTFERALLSGQMTGEQVIKMLTDGIGVDYNELRNRPRGTPGTLAYPPGTVIGGGAPPPP
jgi:hypothetical protein